MLFTHIAHHQERDAQLMTHRINGGAEDQVFETAVTVGSHHQEVGLNGASATDDLPVGIGRVGYYGFHIDAFSAKGIYDFIQVFAARLNLGGGRERPINLTGDAFLNVQQKQLGMMSARHGGGMSDGLLVERRMIQGDENSVVNGGGGSRGGGGRKGDQRAPEAHAPASEQRFDGDPKQQQADREENRNDQRDHVGTVRASACNPLRYRLPDQPGVEYHDDRGSDPRQHGNPGLVGELSHTAPLAGEMHQRNDGEGELHVDDHLAQDQQPIGPFIAGEIDGKSRGNNRQTAGDEAPEPGAHAEIQKTFHHDLAGEGSGKGGRLSRAKQRDGEDGACRRGAEQRREQQVCLLDFGDNDAPTEKHCGCDHQDGGIHQQGSVERHYRIDQVVPAGDALGGFGHSDTACLHQGRMQIKIVRHHGGANDGDGDVETLVVEARNQSRDQRREGGLGQEDFQTETTRNHGNERQDEGFNNADAVTLEP